MQSFLGMINFLKRYSPWLAELSTALRELCRIHADYKPKSEHHKSFDAIKRELSTNIVLPYYNPTWHTTLQTDSSKKGLRAVLIQNSTPIYFASRAISTTEANYQNLKWETLATIWGMEKFHYFLYGNEIHIRNWSEATCFNILETPNWCGSKNTKTNHMRITIQFYTLYTSLVNRYQWPMHILRNLKTSEDKEGKPNFHCQF